MNMTEALNFAENRREQALAKAKRILGGYTVAELKDAEVVLYDSPDISNPGGYWHIWVVLERPVFFGLTKWKRTLHFGQTVESDDDAVQIVRTYAENLLKAVKAQRHI